MSVQTMIRFRYLASQLSPSESAEFAIKLINLPNNFLINILFNHFINELNIGNASDVNAVNTVISNIILSRKKKPKPNTLNTSQNIKLDHIPSQLLGHTASFLTQYDYINFSKANRLIYLATNTPNSLQELDLINISNYAMVNLSSFPFLRSLSIKLTKINGFIPPQSCTLHHLQSITLFGAQRQNFDINVLNNFLITHNVNIDSITALNCWGFGKPGAISFNTASFAEILAIFPNIQYLFLCGICADIDAEHVKNIYSNLKGLSLDGGRRHFYRPLIHEFAASLQFLKLHHPHDRPDYNLDNACFRKLEELMMMRPTVKHINDILKTAINLKKIVIQSTIRGLTFLTTEEVKNICAKLIKTCKSLEYIQFIDDCNGTLVESALEGFVNGLFETRKVHRDRFKINIKTKSTTFLLIVARIIHWLKESEITDFMLIIEPDNSEKISLNDLKENLPSNVVVIQNTNVVTIANKDCNVHGIIEHSSCPFIAY